HLMHAIAEVNIPDAARRIHHRRARRAPNAGVTGEVAFAVVSLDFGDEPRLGAAAGQPPHEMLPEQPPRERHRFLRAQFFRFDYPAHALSSPPKTPCTQP